MKTKRDLSFSESDYTSTKNSKLPNTNHSSKNFFQKKNQANFKEDSLQEKTSPAPPNKKLVILERKRIFSLNNLEKLLKRSPKKKYFESKEEIQLLDKQHAPFSLQIDELTSKRPYKSRKKLIESLDVINKRLEKLAKNEKLIVYNEKSLKSEKNLLLKEKEKLESCILYEEDNESLYDKGNSNSLKIKINELDKQFLQKKQNLIEIEKNMKHCKIELKNLKVYEKNAFARMEEIEYNLKEKQGKIEYLSREIEEKEELLNQKEILKNENEVIFQKNQKDLGELLEEKKRIEEENNVRKQELSTKLNDLIKYEKKIKECFNDLEQARMNLQEKNKKYDLDCKKLKENEENLFRNNENSNKIDLDLQVLKEKLKNHEKELDQREKNLIYKENQLIIRENAIKLKQEDLDSLLEETKHVRNEILHEKEKEMKKWKDKENIIKMKEIELKDKENALNEKYTNNDEYELKVMGLQMNERMIKKKIDLEMKTYMSEINRIKKNSQKNDKLL